MTSGLIAVIVMVLVFEVIPDTIEATAKWWRKRHR